MRLTKTEWDEASANLIMALPSDTNEALRVLAVAFASVAMAVGANDESALDYVKRALQYMRDKETEFMQ